MVLSHPELFQWQHHPSLRYSNTAHRYISIVFHLFKHTFYAKRAKHGIVQTPELQVTEGMSRWVAKNILFLETPTPLVAARCAEVLREGRQAHKPRAQRLQYHKTLMTLK